ncbi:MAG: hypothetical protein IJA16_03085 [Clostridia bacterium]|nr:hypothetical protein [Clostridia bacterium]
MARSSDYCPLKLLSFIRAHFLHSPSLALQGGRGADLKENGDYAPSPSDPRRGSDTTQAAALWGISPSSSGD